MSFFNLFYKNLIGCKIKESDFMCNDKVKVNNFNYSVVSLTPKYSTEKYKIDKLIDKLKTGNRNHTLNDYETFNDQIQKITDELNELKLINTMKGGVKSDRKITYQKKRYEPYKSFKSSNENDFETKYTNIIQSNYSLKRDSIYKIPKNKILTVSNMEVEY